MERHIEQRLEKYPTHNEVIVDFVRHGETEYTGEGLDLTEEGQEQIKKEMTPVVDSIDSEQDIVVLWSSPTPRAQGSEEIIKTLLQERGIKVFRKTEIGSMRTLDRKDKKFFENLWGQIEETGEDFDVMFSNDPKFQEKSNQFESQPEVRSRAERVFNWIRYLAEHANLQNKRLRIIGATHFEFLNPIMEDIFEYKAKDGEGVQRGENLKISFDYNPTNKEVEVSAEFRGEVKRNIVFDKRLRKFVIYDN